MKNSSSKWGIEIFGVNWMVILPFEQQMVYWIFSTSVNNTVRICQNKPILSERVKYVRYDLQMTVKYIICLLLYFKIKLLVLVFSVFTDYT